MGDGERARQAAARLLEVLGAQGVTDRGSESHEERMIRRAQSVLGRDT
jgi:hypothetical protein